LMWNVSTFINIGRNPADFVCKTKICCTLISVAGFFVLQK
jgi:hypothetical protein